MERTYVKGYKKLLCCILAFTMVMTAGFFGDGKAFADDTFSFYDNWTLDVTNAVYDYLNEVYIEKYPEMGLRFRYGAPADRADLQNLADSITDGMTDDMEKAKAIARWVKAGIEYENGSPFPIDTFRNRVGVCLNYSLLASQLMRLEGIPSVMVDGYRGNMKTVEYSNLKNSGHAWLYAYINGDWVMFDPLWFGGIPITDREYQATWYYINTIEGIFMYPDEERMGDINRFRAYGDGPVYYEGRFKYAFDGRADYEYNPENLGNSLMYLNQISIRTVIRILQGTIHDGNSYLGDVNNEKRSRMVAGELYSDGWIYYGDYGALTYCFENGILATETVFKEGEKTIYCDNFGTGWIINAEDDDFWLKYGKPAFETGTSGKLFHIYCYYPDCSDEDFIYTYSLAKEYFLISAVSPLICTVPPFVVHATVNDSVPLLPLVFVSVNVPVVAV